MEPKSSLPPSQVPVTCPYPEPSRSSPYPHMPLPQDPTYYYPPIYAWVSQMVSFPQVSPLKPCIRHSSPPYALRAPPISFFSILSPEQYWVRSTDQSAPHYAASSTTLLPVPPRHEYSAQQPIFKHPQPAFLPPCERPSFTSVQHNRQNYNSV